MRQIIYAESIGAAMIFLTWLKDLLLRFVLMPMLPFFCRPRE
jgi:hypothetical protein